MRTETCLLELQDYECGGIWSTASLNIAFEEQKVYIYMYVHIYMCTCIYIYVCAYIYVYVSWLYAWMDGWMNGCMYFCKCVSIHVCMYLRMYKPKHSAAFPPSASERLSHKRILVCQYTCGCVAGTKIHRLVPKVSATQRRRCSAKQRIWTTQLGCCNPPDMAGHLQKANLWTPVQVV